MCFCSVDISNRWYFATINFLEFRENVFTFFLTNKRRFTVILNIAVSCLQKRKIMKRRSIEPVNSAYGATNGLLFSMNPACW